MKMEEIKKIIQKAGPVKLGIVVICGILLILVSYGMSDSGDEGDKENPEETAVQQTDLKLQQTQYREQMKQELVELLRQVDGVGSVEVMLTLKASNEKVTLKDNTDRGNAREEETVLIEDSDRNSTPYVIQEKEPELEGVVIVCDGGDDAGVKREITEAVSALFQIESHKIKIMKSKEAKE